MPDVDASLAILAGRALIAGPQANPVTGDEYGFRHALLRDAGYASLSRAERARLHVRLARWLERAAGERVQDVAEAVGNNYEAGLLSTPALALEVGDGLDRTATASLAAHWLERAGDLASQRFANDAARSLYTRSVDLSDGDSGLDIARRWRRLAEATGRSAELDDAAAAFGRAVERYQVVLLDPGASMPTRTEARRGLGKAAAGQADVRYEQMRFGEARSIAEAALELTGPEDALATVPLLIARINGLEGLSNEYGALYGEAQEVVRLAMPTGDPDLIFDARRVALGLGHAAGLTTPEDWLEFATEAQDLGRWEATVGAMVNAAGLLSVGDRDRFRSLTDQAEELAQARGLPERLAWIGQSRSELELEAGDWDLARREGIRSLDLSDARGYVRAAVRTWFALTPIAAARVDRELLERAVSWFDQRRDAFPTSPYGSVNLAAVDLRLAAAGLGPDPDLDPAALLDGFGLAENAPSWLASIERIVEAWLDRGAVEVAGPAVKRYCAVELPAVSPLVAASRSMVQGLVALHGGGREAAVSAGRDSLASARTAQAPWWISRVLRLLEAAGAATGAELEEAGRIEGELGIAT